ncbi:MAG: endonuclease domain-containing protein [Muribaculaceae bacterium]|nr:endonuclease domain-containing protein [Muribaculaceae bacterium]
MKRSKNLKDKKESRRELRTNMTIAEAALWKLLKNKNVAGLQFRRQFSIDKYILDFYCPELKLAIELDGDYHYHMSQPRADYVRDQYLSENFGIKTLRFENKVVFSQQWVITNSILHEKATQQSSPPKLGGVAHRAEGVCQRGDAAPYAGVTHSSALTGTSPNLGEELSSPTRSLSPNLGEELDSPNLGEELEGVAKKALTPRFVVFDTNAYRDYVRPFTTTQVTAEISKLCAAERSRGITVLMNTTVARELVSHLADAPSTSSFQECLRAAVAMYRHCGGSPQSFNLLPLPEAQFSHYFFGIDNQKAISVQQAIGQFLFRLSQSPDIATVDANRSLIDQVAQFINEAETTLVNEIHGFCSGIDPNFSKWKLFAGDQSKRKKWLDHVRSAQFKEETAAAYLCALAIDLTGQGYRPQSLSRDMIDGYLQATKAAMQLRETFFVGLTGFTNLDKGSNKNFLWDEQIMTCVGQTCQNHPLLLVTSDGGMIAAAQKAQLGDYVMKLDDYKTYLGI